MENTINIDGVYYNPYDIIGVSKNSTDSEIKSAFNKRVKRYHPDKCSIEKREDYSMKYNIVIKSYEFIKNKRKIVNRTASDCKENKKIDTVKFNKEFEKGMNDPNEFGYGNHTKINSIEEYENFDVKIQKQLDGKFNNEQFNKLFEYLSVKEESNEKSLVHKTNDNFYGYNTSNFNNCSSVSSYNGLMVCGDSYGQSGIGYWDSRYSDYNGVFTKPKISLDKKIVVPEDFTIPTENIPERDFSSYKKEYQSYNETYTKSKRELEREYMETQVKQMEIEAEKNKEFILKYNTYDNKMIEEGFNGGLEKSNSYLDVLKRDVKRLN
jgi:curved DNA-binding protein CbpA